jgi:prolipoprotein diacylglyceryltransferase
MILAPAWFIALDLLAAYLPMAWLGIRIGTWIGQRSTGARKDEA